jgi:uncharacterized protein (DUF1778 family)
MATKDDRIVMRINPLEKARWSEAAEARGQTLSEYIRYTVNRAVDQDRGKE